MYHPFSWDIIEGRRDITKTVFEVPYCEDILTTDVFSLKNIFLVSVAITHYKK